MKDLSRENQPSRTGVRDDNKQVCLVVIKIETRGQGQCQQKSRQSPLQFIAGGELFSCEVVNLIQKCRSQVLIVTHMVARNPPLDSPRNSLELDFEIDN